MISHRINQPPALVSRIDHAWNMECNVDLVWSSSIFRMIKAASDIFNANTGYDQKERWSFFDIATKTIIPNMEADCSSVCGAIAVLGGFDVDLTGARSSAKRFYSGSAADRLEAAGFTRIPYSDLSQLQVGDFIIGPGHMEFIPEVGKMFSANKDENGAATGGSAGNQTSKETRFTKAYKRTKGWTTIMRPPSEDTGEIVNPTNEQIHRGIEGIIQSLQDLQKLYETPVEPPRAENSFDTWEEAVEYYNLPRNLDYIYWDYDGPNDVWEQHKRIGKDAVLVLRERDEPHILNSSKGFPAAGVGWIDGPDGTRTPVVHDANRWFEMSRGNVLGLGPRAVIEVGESDWTAPAQPYPMSYYDRNGVKQKVLEGNQNALIRTHSKFGIFANFTIRGRSLGDVCYTALSGSRNEIYYVYDIVADKANRGGAAIPNLETAVIGYYGGTDKNKIYTYEINNVLINNFNGRSSSPIMINRSSGGVIRNVEMINEPTYGMPTYWRSWGDHQVYNSTIKSPKAGFNFEGNENFNFKCHFSHIEVGDGGYHFNIDPYGGSIGIETWGLTYSPNGYTPNTMVYHTYHASKPEMAATQRDIDIVGDNPKSLIPKERWLLTNP